MALVNSGTLELGLPRTQPANRNISSEFPQGNPAPYGLNEYYGVAGGVPNSGQIAFSNFYGASAYTPMTVNISTQDHAAQDCSRPYIVYTTRANNLSVTGGNGSYNRDWDGANAQNGDSTIFFENIDNKTGSNINQATFNLRANRGGELNGAGYYNVIVSDGTNSINRAYFHRAFYNMGCF